MQHSDSFYVCFTWYKTSLTWLAKDYGTNTLIYLQISIVLRAPPSFLLALLFLNQQSDHTNADKLWHHCKITKKWTTHKPFLVLSHKYHGTTNFLLATLLEKMRHHIWRSAFGVPIRCCAVFTCVVLNWISLDGCFSPVILTVHISEVCTYVSCLLRKECVSFWMTINRKIYWALRKSPRKFIEWLLPHLDLVYESQSALVVATLPHGWYCVLSERKKSADILVTCQWREWLPGMSDSPEIDT